MANNEIGKINESYDLALKLGLDKASELERRVFKDSLYQIAIAVTESIRTEMTDTICRRDLEYVIAKNHE